MTLSIHVRQRHHKDIVRSQIKSNYPSNTTMTNIDLKSSLLVPTDMDLGETMKSARTEVVLRRQRRDGAERCRQRDSDPPSSDQWRSAALRV